MTEQIDFYAPVSMGTTLAAIVYEGGVLMGSDTRTTQGAFISDRIAIKANQISPDVVNFGNIYVMRCGNAAHSQVITRYVFNYLSYHSMELRPGQQIDLHTVTTLFKNICYNNKNHLSCAFILTDGKQLTSVDSSGAYFKHHDWASYGSGSIFINGFLVNNVKPRLTLAQAQRVLSKAIALAIHSDTSSGGCVRIVNVSSTGQAEKTLIDNSQVEALATSE